MNSVIIPVEKIIIVMNDVHLVLDDLYRIIAVMMEIRVIMIAVLRGEIEFFVFFAKKRESIVMAPLLAFDLQNHCFL